MNQMQQVIASDRSGTAFNITFYDTLFNVKFVRIKDTNYNDWPSTGYLTIVVYDYSKSSQVPANRLFSGDYDNHIVLVNEGAKSYQCKVGDLLSADERVNNEDRILMVHRQVLGIDQTYQVTLTRIADKYGAFADPGQFEFTGNGLLPPGGGQSVNWTVPAGVRYISILCVGAGGGGGASYWAGGGGGGGCLSYYNTLKVKQGQRLQVRIGGGGASTTANDGGVGGNGGDTWVRDIDTGQYLCFAGGGQGGKGSPYDYVGGISPPPYPGYNVAGPWAGGSGGTATIGVSGQQVNIGGNGGEGGGDGDGRDYDSAGGGGAPGTYYTPGAYGQNSNGTPSVLYPLNGTGGAAAGQQGRNTLAQSAGGIGLRGKGETARIPGEGGSGGTDGNFDLITGDYGGGGAGQGSDFMGSSSAPGGRGGARIIWPGNVRQYPITRTADE